MKKLLWLVFALLAAPAFAQVQVESALSTTTCPGAGCIVLNVQGQGSAGVQVVGAMTGTLQFEQAADSAGTYTTWPVYPNGSTTTVTSATAAGLWSGSVAGVRFVRVRFSAYTSGTPTVSLVSSQAKITPPVGSSTAGGTCTNQAVTAVAATTAAPTCTTLTSAYVNNTIALTGTDVNTANQVTATHLAAALPVAQGGTGLATLTANALYAGNGTSAPTALAVCGTGTYVRGVTAGNPICSTLTLPNTVAAGNVLVASATNVVSAATPGSVNALPANQTGNSTTTLKMNGLGAAAAPCVVTPATSGRVGFAISGQAVQSTTADGISINMRYGTGTAPANAAAATGTALTPTLTHTALTGALEEFFSLTGVATGLSLVATWFDLQVAEVTGGTASITNVTCAAWEF